MGGVLSASNWKTSEGHETGRELFVQLHVCLALTWFSYASKQDAFGNQSAHPCFINHLSASAKNPTPSPSVSVLLQAALLSARCGFMCVCMCVQRGGAGVLGGEFVLWLCRRCHSHYVVSLLWRCPPVTMGSLACLHVVHVNLFCLPDENIVCNWEEWCKLLVWGKKNQYAGNSKSEKVVNLCIPPSIWVSQLFIHEYTVFSSNITNSMTGKRQQEANIFWFYLEQ